MHALCVFYLSPAGSGKLIDWLQNGKIYKADILDLPYIHDECYKLLERTCHTFNAWHSSFITKEQDKIEDSWLRFRTNSIRFNTLQ